MRILKVVSSTGQISDIDMILTDSKKMLMCDFEDCANKVIVSEKEIGGHIHHPEHTLFAKAERKGWACSTDGEFFYCPNHLVAGIKIGPKFK